MDKNAIKKYAVWARRELISRVMVKAEQYGITKTSTIDANADSVNGHILSASEKQQRQALIARIAQKDYEQVMEEVAYTWFNRFSALRFMEVNGYLPTRIRVFTDETGAFKPQILAEAIHLEMDGLDMDKVYALKDANRSEELYKYLLITQCNALSAILPGMFQKIEDFTELLFPDMLLREGSVLEQIVTLIPEADWQDQVQIIGWLYQYYNTEPKDKVFADLKKNIKISKEHIPAATQLFTPDWIVRYMVENSLGRLWIEGHPNDALRAGWKYYLDEAEQEPDVQAQLAEIRKEYAAIKPEEIRCVDPCMGSGHILAYLFDVLMQIYEAYGFRSRDAVASIVRNNLYGLDIDDRAAQLAYFSVMMKARQYDSRFFTRGIAPNVYAICESNRLDPHMVEAFIGGDAARKKVMETILAELHDAKEYGSILNVTPQDFSALYARMDAMQDEISMFTQPVWEQLLPLIRVAEALAKKYDVVVTNPPYMGSSGMSAKLSEYVKKNYPDSKSDLFAVFIERCGEMLKERGYQAMITQHAWMFLSSFEKLRGKLQKCKLVNMAHLGARAFEEIGGEVVQTTSFVMQKTHIACFKGMYCRLIEPTTQQGKEDMFLSLANRFAACQDNFAKIPGAPVAYWVSENFTKMFTHNTIRDVAFAGIGMRTGDNDRFLRLWPEVDSQKMLTDCHDANDAISRHAKWIPYNKGGEFRQWYGNNEYVVNWENNGQEIKENTRRVYPQLGDNLGWKISNEQYYFVPGITWTVISSKYTSFRRYYSGSIISNSGQSVIVDNANTLDYLTGLLNSKIVREVLSIISPTIGFESGYINKVPVLINNERFDAIVNLVRNCISISRADWDSFETSWDFKRHPLCQIDHIGMETLFGMKINQQVWIKKLRDGSACFSPVNDLIIEGEKKANNEQGDKYEGVFARLNKNDKRINEMRLLLGDDLEELCDGDYVLLRRLSCRTIPVFCMYGFYKEDAEIISQQNLPNGSMECRLRFRPSKSMFDKFLNGNSSNGNQENAFGIGFSVGHMQDALHESLAKHGKRTHDVKILYDLDFTREFFIEPTSEYPELQHKAQRLSYQKEIRFILLDEHRHDKYILEYAPLSERSAGLFEGETYYECDVIGHMKDAVLLRYMYSQWKDECDIRFNTLKANEEELNRIFIDIYGLQDELTPEVADKDVTVRLADKKRDIRSLISYAVGCMFGRYSLDAEGLAYAGGAWDASKYTTFPADKDNVIPICDDEYFDDDITGRFVKFIETVYGKDTLDENLRFIADALGGNGQPKDVIRSYFLNDFYTDHLRIYQKRPIYWLFDSGKKNGFKALIYMHRYAPDTIARLRTDYVHEQQARYRTAIADLERRIAGASAADRVKLTKQFTKLQDQSDEIHVFEEKIHHLADRMIRIDLDDGVKHNYEIFGDVLAKIN